MPDEKADEEADEKADEKADDSFAVSPASSPGPPDAAAAAPCGRTGADIARYQRTKPMSSAAAEVNSISGKRSISG